MNSPQKYLEDYFTQEISEQIFSGRNFSKVQSLCFVLRFNPQNQSSSNKELGAEIRKSYDPQFNVNSFGTTLGETIDKLKVKFEPEMERDLVPLDKLNPGRGKPPRGEAPWEIIYRWLWGKKFLREGWQLCQKIGVLAESQLQMIGMRYLSDDKRGMYLDEEDLKSPEPPLYVGEKYLLQADFPEEGHLLLINQSAEGDRYCLCPSIIYAPDSELSIDESFSIPQSKAYAKSLKFNRVGQEYFLAIITPKPIDLSWVRDRIDPISLDLVKLNDERVMEIFLKLGQQGRSQVYYKTFQVIERT